MNPKFAILLDGGFVTKTLGNRKKAFPSAADIVAECDRIKAHSLLANHDLLRIYYYDAPPSTEVMTNPIDGTTVDLWVHKHAEVKAWLAEHPRFHMHFTPTSSSWLNLVERFFRDVTDRIRGCSFASVRELSDTIIAFLADRNQNPKRYVWKAKGEDILRKIQQARQALAQQQASA